jgi:putative transposase
MENRKSSHTTTNIMVHLVWITKYRYPVLRGDIKKRCHKLIIQICDAMDIRIIGGVVSTDHIHLHIEYPPKLSISDVVRRLKGRTSNKIQMEFPQLKKRYWGKHLWAIGYGAWSTGNITKEILAEYLKHHGLRPNEGNDKLGME